jgi:acyl-CoA synthetase (AMP-forming)/AMP-acid ligase II
MFAIRPDIKFFHYYGLTEASRTTFICFNDSLDKLQSVGQPMKHSRVKIVMEDGGDASTGQVGEVLIGGDAVFRGYWGDDHNLNPFRKDGWFPSGDLGFLDCEGFLFLVGRKGDMINIDGLKFHPSDVEKVLEELAFISEAGVVAMPDRGAICGIALIAMVVLAPQSLLDLEQVRTHCYTKLRTVQVPKRFVSVSYLPQRQSGKRDRTKLMDEAKNFAPQW